MSDLGSGSLTRRGRRLVVWAAAVALALAALRPAGAAAGTIRVSGTGGAVTSFRFLGDEFRKTHPNIQVAVLPVMGTSGAVKALLAGKLDIALSARPLNDEERAGAIVARPYAKTPFVFGANDSVKVYGLSLAEAADIYAGRKVRWRDGRRIRLILRPPGDSDVAALESMSPRMKEAVKAALKREGMVVGLNEQDAADAIERTPGGFGALSLSLVLSENRAIGVFPLDGVVPSVQSVKDGSYPHSKTYYAVTRRDSPPAVREFLEFVRSPAGAAVMLKYGQMAVR